MPHISHNRAWLIGLIYVAGAMLPELRHGLAGASPINWPLLAVDMAIPGGIALRSYLDGTMENLRAQNSPPADPDSTSNSGLPPGQDTAAPPAS
jgi:hypothetical protein